ncbi:MAG: hypothetical protein QOJ13_1906 [Gaiellales bacterium]|jgi:hypothetical protein|nr:hypothetical protein [Gaiellales bacterium]
MEFLLLYVLPVLVILGLPGWFLWMRSTKRQMEQAPWRVSIRSDTEGTVVELIRSGERTQRVAVLDPADEEFSTRLEEARSQALERATALNVARKGLP